jgi:hypothetical protein
VTEGAPEPLPPRQPRSLIVHAAVDAAVAFLLIAIVGLFFGATLWVLGLIGAAIGVAVAPLTRRAEEEALSRREPPTP